MEAFGRPNNFVTRVTLAHTNLHNVGKYLSKASLFKKIIPYFRIVLIILTLFKIIQNIQIVIQLE